MNLRDLLPALDAVSVQGSVDLAVKGVSCDSRQVTEGTLYVALHGEHYDDSSFIDDAVSAGAVAVMLSAGSPATVPTGTTRIEVAAPRIAMALASCLVFNQPSEHIPVIGVTGTNGKTSVSFMVRDILRAAGEAPGLIGTVAYEWGTRRIPATRTTPEAPELQGILAHMVAEGCTCAVMEVSSHALHQERAHGVAFRTAVFTNLTSEHLDYHGTMEEYFDVKRRLFQLSPQAGGPTARVIGLDDAWGRKLAAAQPERSAVLSFGLTESADVRADNVAVSLQGSTFECSTPWGATEMAINVPGRFNVLNALAAVAVCGEFGVSLDVVKKALAHLEPVPGRLQSIENARGLHVFVDYAHTPDALHHALSTLRELAPRRLLVAFGCGGDRDKSKRALMAREAERLADFSILTSDNPRTEDPASIIRDIAQGFHDNDAYAIEVDRREAIQTVLSQAEEGDTILVAGKGHEDYQQFHDTVVPFDDRAVLRDLMAGG